MGVVKRKAASSRSAVATAIRSRGATSAVTSLRSTFTVSMSPKRAASRSTSEVSLITLMCDALLTRDRVGATDLLLQLQDAVDQRFGRRRATRHIDIDRNDAIAAANDRVGIMVVAAAIGAGTHGDDPLRLGHLVIDLAQRRGHLVDQGAGDDHHVGLARARTEDDAEAIEIQARGTGVHHFDG